MTNSNQLLSDRNETSSFTEESDRVPSNTDTTTTTSNSEIVRLLTGVLIGATLGGIASILSSKSAISRINQNVQKVGSVVDKTATNINNTVKDVGEAVQSVAVVVNDTFQDVEVTVKNTADDVNTTVKSTVSAVKNTAQSVNNTVKTTADIINTVKQPVENTESKQSKQPNNNGGNETLYKLVPIE
jgi:phage-related protein